VRRKKRAQGKGVPSLSMLVMGKRGGKRGKGGMRNPPPMLLVRGGRFEKRGEWRPFACMEKRGKKYRAVFLSRRRKKTFRGEEDISRSS